MNGRPPHLVIGAGVCGLYAGLQLARRGIPVLILEKDERVGGLAGSPRIDGNPHDFGVHMLHGFDRRLRDDLLELMGDEAVPVPLDARIRWRGHEFRYPLEFPDLVKGMPPLELLRGVMGLLGAGIRKRFAGGRPSRNAEEALVHLYGASLYRSFFEEFTHRYWGLHPSRLSATFIARKMPRLTAMDAVRKVLQQLGLRVPEPSVESALREETLYYSRHGAAGLPEALAREVRRLGGNIVTSAQLRSVHLPDQGQGAAEFVADGTMVEAPIRGCLSTIPLTSLLKVLTPAAPSTVVEVARALRYRALAIHGLLIRKDRCMDALYTYFRDRCFHRVAEPKNAGMPVTPEGHTLLLIERMCDPGDPVWLGSPAEMQATVDDAVAETLFDPDDLVATNVIHARHAYPVFDLGFEDHLRTVQRHLATIDGLRSLGRQGGFSYPNMHSAMNEGAQAAAECYPNVTSDGV